MSNECIIDVFDNKIFQNMLLSKTVKISKESKTLVRKVTKEEIGSVLITWVKDDNGIKEEMRITLTDEMRICRNPNPIGEDDKDKPVYNERYSDKDGLQRNYQVLPDHSDFKPYKKIPLIEAVQLTKDLIKDAFGVEVSDDDSLCYFSNYGKKRSCKIGDYITKTFTVLSGDMFETGDYKLI